MASAKMTHRSNQIGLFKFAIWNQEGLLLAIGQPLISKKLDLVNNQI